MGWETRYRQGSLPPKSGHGAVPVRLPFSSSFLPFRFSFPARCSACPVPSIAFTEGSGALGGGPSSGPIRGQQALSSGRGSSSSPAMVSSSPFSTEDGGAAGTPSSASQSGMWTGAPGVWARLRGPAASPGPAPSA